MKLTLKTVVALAAIAAAPLMTNAQAEANSFDYSNAQLIATDVSPTINVGEMEAEIEASGVTLIGFKKHHGFHGHRSFNNRGFRSSRGFRGNRGFRSSRGFRGNRGFRGGRRGGFRR